MLTWFALMRGRPWYSLLAAPDDFEACAQLPSGRRGGNLGQVGRGDTLPEFERARFRLGPTGVLCELVVDQRIPGRTLTFDAVHARLAERLKASAEEQPLRQYAPPWPIRQTSGASISSRDEPACAVICCGARRRGGDTIVASTDGAPLRRH
jgi:hypothetical protein